MNSEKLISLLKRKIVFWPLVALLITASASVLFLGVVFLYAYSLGPPSLTNDHNTVYYSSDGFVIGEEHGAESRYWVDLEDISPLLVDATVTTEDKRFYEHHGFDYKRMLRAALTDLREMSMVEGASTITQQYARNLYLSHEKTWTRKLKEAFYTIRLEMFYEKKEILEGYLNTIYFGHGAYGIEAASRYFLNKHASELDLAEATLLAGIPNGPAFYSPIDHWENAKKRQEQVLATLAKEDVINKQQEFLASRQLIELTEPKQRETISIAPYYQDVVLRELEALLDTNREEIRSGGYQVYTTLNFDHQEQLEQTVEDQLPPQSDLQIGAMAMEPESGAVISLVGGRDYKQSQFNRVTQAKRMPGSSFKPFLYYAALENGYTAITPLMSSPTNFELADGTVYQPSNYNGYYADRPITLAQALALSDNIYAVKTNLFLTPEKLVDTARQFGISGYLPAVPSLALGTASVSLQEMVTGYSMLANGGMQVEPYTVEKITDSHGNVLYEHPEKEVTQVLDPNTAFILTHLMTGIFDESLNGYMRVTGASIADQLKHTYAGKSGTTTTDNWMIGYSPDLVTGVWSGYDDNIPIEKSVDRSAAKKVWASFMNKAHEDMPFKTFPIPDGVVGAYVDPTSGELATSYCKDQRLMFFTEGTEPTSHCSLHLPSDAEVEQEEQTVPDDTEEENRLNRFFDWIF
ncbi:transglycosylase domain-containing protein [Radiobacillus sp. PE A8.2]|uniref:transglycosylase domain-containing protein n=1 Tax=Radiobacillus sp. PE A8.2 TaxID=3380349 RepID=UPI00388F90B9